jgi:hypothetical protein
VTRKLAAKPFFLLATLSPRHPRYSLSAKTDKASKLWDIEKEETGASLIGTKKRSHFAASWREKDEGARGRSENYTKKSELVA